MVQLRAKYTAPEHNKNGFNCPFCEAFAQQTWFTVCNFNGGNMYKIPDLTTCMCTRCNNFSIWYKKEMIYPASSIASLPTEDMPEDVKEDFLEARNIVNASPRASTALLRLALQKLLPHLGEKGENINEEIGNLVKKGLPEKIQKALDSLRVIGNNAVHPGQIDLKDDVTTACALFDLLNMIVEVMITQPKKVDGIYDKIPDELQEAIKKRDGKS